MWLKGILFLTVIIIAAVGRKIKGNTPDSVFIVKQPSVLAVKLRSILIGTLLFYLMFSLLTFTFIWPLLLLQVLAVFLNSFIQVISSAYLGIDTLEKRNKFFCLEILAGMRIAKIGKWIGLFSTRLNITCVIISIIVFWIFPLNDKVGNTLILAFFYLVPALLGNILIFCFQAFQMLLYEVEKDKRDFLLIQSLSATIFLFTKFSIPVILIKMFPENYIFSNLPAWLFIVFPFVLFFSMILVPYFIGHGRHREYVKSLLLDYKYLVTEALSSYYMSDLGTQTKGVQTIKSYITSDYKIKAIESRLEQFEKVIEANYSDNSQVQLWQKVLSNFKSQPEKLDFSFYYYRKVQELFLCLDKRKFPMSEGYLKFSLDNNLITRADEVRKTTLTIISFTLLSGLIAYVFKLFEPEVISLLQKL